MRKLMMATALSGALVMGLAACSDGADTEAAPEHTYAPGDYMLAINDIARSDDLEADATRLPGELLAFAQIDRGEVVGDYIMGGGYVTRLLAVAVGSDGKVYAFQPDEFIAFRPEYADEQADTVRRYADNDGNPVNVIPLNGPVASPPWPEPLDTIITVMNFHDLYIPEMPEGTGDTGVQSLYDALKPGGTLVVIDHSAVDGTGTDSTGDTHRIDRQTAIDALEAVGFTLEEESDLYAHPDDPRTANVFDEAIRGRTDQFALRLRKPE